MSAWHYTYCFTQCGSFIFLSRLASVALYKSGIKHDMLGGAAIAAVVVSEEAKVAVTLNYMSFS